MFGSLAGTINGVKKPLGQQNSYCVPAQKRTVRLRSRVAVQARARRNRLPDPQEDEEEKKSGGLLSKFFSNPGSSGTKQLRAGQSDSPEAGRQSPRRQRSTPQTPVSEAPSKGTKKVGQGIGNPFSFGGTQSIRAGRRDPQTVFVAGSTGRLGLRIVRQLLLAGFKVRAGARNTDKAKQYVEVAVAIGALSPDAAKRLQVVSVDLEDPSTIVPAIGNAGKVVQAIGAAENNILDFGAPKRIDGNAAISLVEVSNEIGIEQYVMVTSLGTEKFGWPAGALNLFGGILTQKRRAEKALIESGLNYTIVRPGGMERPTDDYKKDNNVRLATKNKLFGGQVSRLQVAELIASAVGSPSLSANKILEVVAESNAPLLDYETLLDQHPGEDEPPQEVSAPTPTPPQVSRSKPQAVDSSKQQELETREKKVFGRRQQQGVAESIAQKEIKQKLRQDGPKPSQAEKNIAEDIAKKEIAIDTGKEESTKSWFNFGGKSKAKPKAAAQSVKPEISQPDTTAAAISPKPSQTPEDVERLRQGRAKSAETRASQEAAFLARMEEERQAEAQKKRDSAEKARQKALEESRKARDSLLAKQAAIQAAKPKPKPAAPAKKAEKKDDSSVKDAQEQAKKNAQEARQWINNWRSEGSDSSKSAANSNGSQPQSKANQNSPGKKSEEPLPNALEAREWIRDWRARSLEKKLPVKGKARN